MSATPDAAALAAAMHDLGHGVHAIDTGFHRAGFDAAYLMVQDGRAAFIETGTNPGVPTLLGALERLGLGRDAVDWVIPTHVHLDHAGGAGLLMSELPNARMLVHPRGAPHMIDPAALVQGALAVYGEAEMRRSYGTIVPVPADRVQTAGDGAVVELAGRALRIAHTPGHAKHHFCVWDEASRGWFTGDAFGSSYPEFDSPAGAWMVPATSPSQFDADDYRRSVERLLRNDPDCVYLTHYGRRGDVPRLAERLLSMLREMVAVARAAAGRPQALRAGLTRLYVDAVRAHGCMLPADRVASLLKLDVDVNALGLELWLAKSG